jgi:hypothetical protein
MLRDRIKQNVPKRADPMPIGALCTTDEIKTVLATVRRRENLRQRRSWARIADSKVGNT